MSIIYFATTKIDSESRICQCFSNSVRGMTNNNRVSLVKTSPLDTLSKHRGYAFANDTTSVDLLPILVHRG